MMVMTKKIMHGKDYPPPSINIQTRGSPANSVRHLPHNDSFVRSYLPRTANLSTIFQTDQVHAGSKREKRTTEHSSNFTVKEQSYHTNTPFKTDPNQNNSTYKKRE